MADVKQRKIWLVINDTQKTVSVLPTRAMMLEQKAHEETIYNFNKIKTLGLTATFDGTRKTLDAVLSRKFPAYDIDSWSYVSKNPTSRERYTAQGELVSDTKALIKDLEFRIATTFSDNKKRIYQEQLRELKDELKNAKNPTSAQVTKCRKVLREAESDDLSYIQSIPISAGFDWEKNPATVWEVIDLETNKIFFTTNDSQAERWNNDERYKVRASPQRRPVRGYNMWMLNSKTDDYSLKLGFDWEKNGVDNHGRNIGGFPVAIMRLVNEIKESQHGKPEDQLTDFQASHLVPAYRHVFENDHGYIKLTPLGKKLHIVDGELKVKNSAVKNAFGHSRSNTTKQKLQDVLALIVGVTPELYNKSTEGELRGRIGEKWNSVNKYTLELIARDYPVIFRQFEKYRNGAAVANPKRKTSLSVPDRHQLKVLRDTLKMNDAAANMFGVGKDYARQTLREKFGYTEAQIKTLENPTKKNESASDFKRFTKDRLIELSKMFQGEASGARNRALSPDMLPAETWRLGYLVQMKIRHNGKVNTINFDGESYLAGDLRCNLWAVGKDARIEGIRKPSEGQLKKLGKLIQVDYVTAKKHIEGGKVVRFWHPLGEVNKDYPTLYIDHDGFPIILGGGYDIWNVGIVN